MLDSDCAHPPNEQWQAEALAAAESFRQREPRAWEAELAESNSMDLGSGLPLEPYAGVDR